MKKDVDVIVPTLRSTKFVECLISSFIKFNNSYNFKFYIVENSNFISDNSYVEGLAENVTVVNNNVDLSRYGNFAGSYYNASACELGLKLSSSDLVFLCHNDVVATKENWLESLHQKLLEGCGAASFIQDKLRINALHISGILTTRRLATNVNLYCRLDSQGAMLLDVGDEITEYCRENNLPVFCHKNTHNSTELVEKVKSPFDTINVVRCLDENDDVIFMHCGRGTPKMLGRYSGKGSGVSEWVDFVNVNLGLNVKVTS